MEIFLIPLSIYLLALLIFKLLSKRNKNKIDFDLDEELTEDPKAQEEKQDEIKTEYKMGTKEAISVARTVDSEMTANYIMAQNWSEEVQVAMAETKNIEAQKFLLNFKELSGEALTVICERPANFNFDSDIVENWFEKAIKRTKLTSKQQIRISRAGYFIMKKALLLKEDLTSNALVELCYNSGRLNLDSDTVKWWYLNAINRTKPSEKQQLKIVETKKYSFLRALLLSDVLKAETLIAISEDPGNLNTESETVWSWFENAVNKTELSVEQQVRMAKLKNFASKRALLWSKHLVYEAFLVICQNPGTFNMENDTVQKHFRETTKRLLPTLNDEQKAELAKTKIKGVLKGLM